MDFKRTPLILLILAAFLFTACAPQVVQDTIAPLDGQVLELQLRGSLHLIRNAIEGKPGAFIMRKGDLYLFAGAVKDAWGFVAINGVSRTPVEDFSVIAEKGNLINCREFSCLSQFLKDNGWKSIPPSAVPAFLKASLYSTVSWISGVAASLVTFIVVPPGAFDMPKEFAPYQIIG